MTTEFKMNRMIKKTCILLFMSLLPTVVIAEPAEEARTPVKVELEGLVGATGTVYIAVYNSDDDWLGDEVFTSAEVDIEKGMDGSLVITELLLPPGEYALTIFHDSNANGELDTNFIGLPKEPIAMSNNAKAKFGPPKYEDAKFDVVLEPVIQRVKIKKL
jgi:uncharacterized protein (DUF2141 family)